MSADQDVDNNLSGVDNAGAALPWRWVRARARTVIGNLNGLLPFNWPNPTYAASTSTYDAITAASEQVSWRYVDSHGRVVCMKDILIAWWEDYIAKTPVVQVNAAWGAGSMLRDWPPDFPGAPPYEK